MECCIVWKCFDVGFAVELLQFSLSNRHTGSVFCWNGADGCFVGVGRLLVLDSWQVGFSYATWDVNCMGAFFQWLLNGLYAIWDAFRRIITSWWSAAIIIVGLAYAGLNLVGNMAITAVTNLGHVFDHSITPGYTGGASTYIFAVANTFLPMDEALRMMAAMVVGVWLPLGLYKFVKSWLGPFGGSGS